jgi:hypothetical protein
MKLEICCEAHMAFEETYFPEEHLILIRVWGTVSLEENREIGQRMSALLDEADAKTDVLFDLRRLERFPTAIGELRQISAVVRSPRLGWIVLLTDNILLKFVATILVQLQTRSKRFCVQDTLPNALHFLEGTQPDTPERKAWLSTLGRSLETSV